MEVIVWVLFFLNLVSVPTFRAVESALAFTLESNALFTFGANKHTALSITRLLPSVIFRAHDTSDHSNTENFNRLHRDFYMASAVNLLSKVGGALSLLTVSQVSLWDLAPTRLKTNRFAESCFAKATQLSEMRFIPSYRMLALALPALAGFNFALDMIQIKCFKEENKTITLIRNTTDQIDKWISIVFFARLSVVSFASIESHKQRIAGAAFTLVSLISFHSPLRKKLPKKILSSSAAGPLTLLVAHATCKLSSRLAWLPQTGTLSVTAINSAVRASTHLKRKTTLER